MEWVFFAIIAAAALYMVVVFNGLVRARNLVSAGWADVDVQLQRRHDLVPRLVKVVAAYADHEKETLEAVTAQRNEAIKAQEIAEKSRREAELDQSIHRLIALAEAYPDLKAGENFERLQQDLVEIEDDLQYARRFYNGAVRDYNIRVERFPDLLAAQAFQFEQADFFQAEDQARSAPRLGDQP
ncbi:MAG: LemA family protein [Xanthomonadales bacterium]|nr:LemA family protein [Xanthomonadales bacterium]